MPPGDNFDGTGETVIGRKYTVSPREGERQFLRLFLKRAKGEKSDIEWKRVLGEIFAPKLVSIFRVFAAFLGKC